MEISRANSENEYFSLENSISPSIYYTPISTSTSSLLKFTQKSYSKKSATIQEKVQHIASQIIKGIYLAYRNFKKDTDETNKWLWIRAQKPQMAQALDRAKLTPQAFLALPLNQFLDPDYIRSKWIDKNIDFALVMIKLLKPKLTITKKNIFEIPKILVAFINNDVFLDRYCEILEKNKKKMSTFIALQTKVDEEYKSFMTDLRKSHKDPYGFELGPIAAQNLRDQKVNDFVGKKMRAAGVTHTSRIGTYWKGGGKITMKNRSK